MAYDRSIAKYMLDETDKFLQAVFIEEPNYAAACGGMVSAHGDKVEQYFRRWSDAGLSIKKAQIIYFLTYTKLLGATPKYKSCEWVIDNYSKYADMLP